LKNNKKINRKKN